MNQITLSNFFGDNTISKPGSVILKPIPEPIKKIIEGIKIETKGKTPKKINEEIRKGIEEGKWNREDLINFYEGLGVEIKSKNGLVGLREARESNYAQFFTPLWVSKFIVDLLKIPENATVLDNAMGTGRLAYYLLNPKLFTGIEFETQAYEIAKKIFPNSNLIQDNLINHVFDNEFDYVLINPPFSINLNTLKGNLIHISYGGGILSQVASLEIGLRAVKKEGYLVAILPDNIWSLESTRLLHKWISEISTEIIKLTLPSSTFVGTEWKTSLFVFQKNLNNYWSKEKVQFNASILSEQDCDTVLTNFQRSDCYREVRDYSHSRDSFNPIILSKEKEKVEEIKSIISKRVLIDNNECPKVLITSVKGNLKFIPNNHLAAIKLENVKANFLTEYDYSLKEYVNQLTEAVKLDPVWSGKTLLKDLEIIKLLSHYGLNYSYSLSLLNWLNKKRRYFKRESSSFEQWIQPKEEGDWIQRYKEEELDTQLIKQQERKLIKYCNQYPHISILYEFQKKDLIRISLKKSTIIAWQQGLGKTKLGIALAILKGCKRNLFIVPSHLKDTWKKEFKNFGIRMHMIERRNDLFNLTKFNLVTYNALKKKLNQKDEGKYKVNKKSGKSEIEFKSFADVLRKKFKVVIVDEAHYLSNKSTKQTKAVAKFKPKYWYLMTGTPIGNTVKNLYSILDIGWKSGSTFFPYTTRQFREEFVSVEWVTPEFDDTLSSGRTAQQMADIKNVDLFMQLMKSKWLRRVKAEPEVQACIAIPKPNIIDIECKPEKEQLLHYKKHLTEFAEIFKKFMKPKESDEHKVDQSIVLAMIQNLQFCSMVPQHPKVNPSEDFTYNGKETATQKEILNLIDSHYKEKKKIILFTQRPDFCNLLSSWLKKKGIESVIFTGQVNIDKRNKRLDDFKFNGINVMLASINVTDTGLNIPQANIAIIAEADWKHSKIEQAYSRILRPQTKGSPIVYCIHTKGTIDSYLWQHAYRKKGAIDETLEGKEEVSKEKWVHWKDFIIEMLIAEGLWEKERGD